MSDLDLPPLTPEALAARELSRLRFGFEEEQQFRLDYEASAIGPRLILLAMGVAMMAITPFYDRFLLHIPESFAAISHMLQFGVQIPPILIAILFTWHPELRRGSATATLVALAVACGGLTLQKIIGAAHGFHVPHDFAALAIAATCLIGRMRLAYLLPWASALMLLVSAALLHGFDYSAAAFYDAISLWMLFMLALVASYLLEHSARENWRQRRLLEVQAVHDALTALPNRRYFDASFVQLIRQAARERKNIALMILDVDYFKPYNDRYGHPAGDDCLRRIGQCLGTAMRRPQDFCARIGGEEFAAVWFDAQIVSGPTLAEKVRAGIGDLNIPHSASMTSAVVTASGGFVQLACPAQEEAATTIAADLMLRADRALYQAKRGGRDRLVDADDPAQNTQPTLF